MSHPGNKYERLLIGKRKGLKRVSLWFRTGESIDERNALIEKHARYRRSTTKICGRRCCANPRKHEKQITLQERRFLSSLKF